MKRPTTGSQPTLDSVTLHALARRHRARAIGDAIAAFVVAALAGVALCAAAGGVGPTALQRFARRRVTP
jgi:hypothetical protein